MEIKKYLYINLQNEEDTKKAAIYNSKNNYIYILKHEGNLINYENMAYLLRIGYNLHFYKDTPELTHKNYKAEEIEEKEGN